MALEDCEDENLSLEQLEVERLALKGQLTNLRARCADLEEGHSRMEEEVAESSISYDRLLVTVSKLEARNRTLVKRQASQEEAFELDRREKMEIERNLASQVQELERQLRTYQFLAPKESESSYSESHMEQELQANHDSRLVAHATIVSQLRSQLADMHESQLSLTEMHTALLSQVHTLEHEVAERTAECYRLREENEGFEILLRERTLDGRVYDADVFGNMTDDDSASDLAESETDSIERGTHGAERNSRKDTDSGEPDAGEEDKPSSRRKRKGPNLAEELGEGAPAQSPSVLSSPTHEEYNINMKSTAENVDSNKMVGDEHLLLNTLRAEVRALTDANKALRLYCSKILDRILLHEDEEHFLVNVSGSVKRSYTQGTTAIGKSTRAPSKKMHRTIALNRRAVTPEIFVQAASSISMRTAEADCTTIEHGREPYQWPSHQQLRQTSDTLTSTAIRTDSAPTREKMHRARTLRPLSIVAKKEEREKEAKKADADHERRLRRGFSLDWRSLSGSLKARPEPPSKPDESLPSNPAMDASLSVPCSQDLPPFIPNNDSQDRKLDIYEEDDEDRIERERLSATLKLMGVTTAKGEMAAIPHELTHATKVNLAPAANTVTGRSSPTPFSRFSAFFGRPSSTNTVSPTATTGNSPTDERVSSLSSRLESVNDGDGGVSRLTPMGRNETERGKPKPQSSVIVGQKIQARPESRAPSAIHASNVFSTHAAYTPHHRTKGGDASLSTLWSLGSEGREM